MDPKEKLAMTLDYLFGRNVSSTLPLDRVNLVFSKRTGRIKTVWLEDALVGTFRPDGGIALTVYGASLLNSSPSFAQNCIVVSDEAAKFVSKGRSVFCKHVVKCGDRIRPKSDVAILDSGGNVIAVGRAVLSSKMIRVFKVGVAVRVREGINS